MDCPVGPRTSPCGPTSSPCGTRWAGTPPSRARVRELGRNRFGSIRFGSGLFERLSGRLGSVRTSIFHGAARLGLCFSACARVGERVMHMTCTRDTPHTFASVRIPGTPPRMPWVASRRIGKVKPTSCPNPTQASLDQIDRCEGPTSWQLNLQSARS